MGVEASHLVRAEHGAREMNRGTGLSRFWICDAIRSERPGREVRALRRVRVQPAALRGIASIDDRAAAAFSRMTRSRGKAALAGLAEVAGCRRSAIRMGRLEFGTSVDREQGAVVEKGRLQRGHRVALRSGELSEESLQEFGSLASCFGKREQLDTHRQILGLGVSRSSSRPSTKTQFGDTVAGHDDRVLLGGSDSLE